MKNRKNIKIHIYTVINLIACAEDYGYEQLYSDFFQMLDNNLSDSEIEEYTNVYMKDFDDEDRESILERLTELRDKYCGE